MDPKNFYHRVYVPALQKAGLQKKSDHQTNSIEDKGQNVDWHTLRHTFASRLGMSGATEQDIAACLRHSGTSLVKRYTHLSQDHWHSVTEKVSQFGRPPSQPLKNRGTVDKSEIKTGEAKEVCE